MNIWILTIGNSDVQLLTEDNWSILSDEIIDQLNYHDFVLIPSDNEHKDSWVAPARVLGMMYQSHLDDEYFNDLYFPLLDNFYQSFIKKPKTTPDEIIYLMTDQSQIFTNYLSLKKSPVWKDTCTLQPIIEHYLKNKFPKAKLKPCILSPQNKQGMADWNSTLEVVREALSQFSYNKPTTIYVSHQAGTPAISSAVQFVTLAQYGKQVKFLVSNEYELISNENEQYSAEIIESSQYLRGLQIEQAKSLILTSPGAAKKLLDGLDNIEPQPLEKLQNFVDFFNLNRSLDNNQSEFEIESATQRIVDTLDLIGIFFNQENYLQGITLLSAAQETFLKVAILTKIKDLTLEVNGTFYKGKEVLIWSAKGLFLSNNLNNSLSIEQKVETLSQLRFPTQNFNFSKNDDFKITNRNSAMLSWLKCLEPKFYPWEVLKWSCKFKRDFDDDLRNQLVHNLRGMERTDVINYLLGYQPSELQDIMKVYNEKVKQPFFEAINLFNLPYTKEKLRKTLEKLADSLS